MPASSRSDSGLIALIDRALAEDVGEGDLTTEATVPATAQARATIRQKAPGVIFGLDVGESTFRRLDERIASRRLVDEGVWREAGPVLELEGPAGALLTAERTALNFLAHLSGVATMAARCVQEVQGTGATILDTRKTTPGLRALEKAAVAAGGATNHRVGLFDAVLIKENHIALAGGITAAVAGVRDRHPQLPFEVECRTVAEIDEGLNAGAGRLLLDNMDPAAVREAVQQVGGRAELECSGGLTLDTLRDYALTGVQFLSVGAITHSTPALDLSLILEPLARPSSTPES
jgi:nicotinate-nucleotide pyrophosphorylase (carboxylating)